MVDRPHQTRNKLEQSQSAVAIVSPQVPAILSRPSSPGEATIFFQMDLDWLQFKGGLSAATSSTQGTPIGALATGEAP